METAAHPPALVLLADGHLPRPVGELVRAVRVPFGVEVFFAVRSSGTWPARWTRCPSCAATECWVKPDATSAIDAHPEPRTP
jgi:hypothetical protein